MGGGHLVRHFESQCFQGHMCTWDNKIHPIKSQANPEGYVPQRSEAWMTRDWVDDAGMWVDTMGCSKKTMHMCHDQLVPQVSKGQAMHVGGGQCT